MCSFLDLGHYNFALYWPGFTPGYCSLFGQYMNSNVLLTCRGNDNEADEPAAAAEADMDELDRYAAGVEREEVEAATPSGSATSAALGYADPPPVKKQKERPRTKTECKRVVAAEL